MSTIAELAQDLITRVRDADLSDDKADLLALPLLQLLREQGHITEHAYIEWQGVFEHELVPVFWFDDAGIDSPTHCLNVNADGTIQVFA